jgi:hypothetical protein
MPFDALPSTLTDEELRDLAVLKAARHRLRHPWRWWKAADTPLRLLPGVRELLLVMFRPHCIVTAVAVEPAHSGALHRLNVAAGMPAHVFNDARTTRHADVLALFDRAIAELEAR